MLLPECLGAALAAFSLPERQSPAFTLKDRFPPMISSLSHSCEVFVGVAARYPASAIAVNCAARRVARRSCGDEGQEKVSAGIGAQQMQSGCGEAKRKGMVRGRCEILGYLIVRIGDWQVPARMDCEGQVGHRGDCPCVAMTLHSCIIASRTAGTSSRTHEQATWGWGGASNCGQHDEAGEDQRMHHLPRTARAHLGPPRVSGASRHLFGASATLRRPARPPRDAAVRAASSPGLSPRPNPSLRDLASDRVLKSVWIHQLSTPHKNGVGPLESDLSFGLLRMVSFSKERVR